MSEEKIGVASEPDSVAPVPAPAQEPEPAEPEAEAESEEDYSPSWLYEDSDREAPTRAGSPAPAQPVPQQAPLPPTGSSLSFDGFVQQPEQWMDRYLSTRMGPMVYGIQQQQMMTRRMIESQATQLGADASRAISSAYRDIYSKSDTFRGNPAVRKRVEAEIRSRYRSAVESARNGDFSQVAMLREPNYYSSVLVLAEHLEGRRGRPESVKPGAAKSERPKSRQSKSTDIELTPDQESMAREMEKRMGSGAREKFIESLKKYGDDIEFG